MNNVLEAMLRPITIDVVWDTKHGPSDHAKVDMIIPGYKYLANSNDKLVIHMLRDDSKVFRPDGTYDTLPYDTEYSYAIVRNKTSKERTFMAFVNYEPRHKAAASINVCHSLGDILSHQYMDELIAEFGYSYSDQMMIIIRTAVAVQFTSMLGIQMDRPDFYKLGMSLGLSVASLDDAFNVPTIHFNDKVSGALELIAYTSVSEHDITNKFNPDSKYKSAMISLKDTFEEFTDKLLDDKPTRDDFDDLVDKVNTLRNLFINQNKKPKFN